MIINGFMSKYPYTDFHEMNLDWLLAQMLQLKTDMKDFVNLNTIKYADPIQWNITTQYQGNTVVVEPVSGDAYLSTQPVPSGVAITDTEYWTLIGSFGSIFTDIKASISAADEGPSMVASGNRAVDDLVWLSDTLYVVTAPIATGETYVPGTNCEEVTIETLLKNERDARMEADTLINDNIGIINGSIATINGNINTINGSIAHLAGEIEELDPVKYTPEHFGAVGDGVADDTAAFQACIDAAITDKRGILATGVYKISAPLIIDTGASYIGSMEKMGIFIFNRIINTSNDYALKFSGNGFRVMGRMIDSATGNGVLVGHNHSVNSSIFDIAIIRSSQGSCYKIDVPDANMNSCGITFRGVLLAYATNAVIMASTNRYVGEITFENLWMRTVEAATDTGGYAVTCDCSSGYGLTGVNFVNCSFEGANNAVEILNTTPTTLQGAINMINVRSSELTTQYSKNLLRVTGTANVYGTITCDVCTLDKIVLPSAPTNQIGNKLTIFGRIRSGGRVYRQAYSGVNKMIPVSDNDYIIFVNSDTTWTSSQIPAGLVRVASGITLTMTIDHPLQGLLIRGDGACTVKINGTSISLNTNEAIEVWTANIDASSVRFIAKKYTTQLFNF